MISVFSRPDPRLLTHPSKSRSRRLFQALSDSTPHTPLSFDLAPIYSSSNLAKHTHSLALSLLQHKQTKRHVCAKLTPRLLVLSQRPQSPHLQPHPPSPLRPQKQRPSPLHNPPLKGLSRHPIPARRLLHDICLQRPQRSHPQKGVLSRGKSHYTTSQTTRSVSETGIPAGEKRMWGCCWGGGTRYGGYL